MFGTATSGLTDAQGKVFSLTYNAAGLCTNVADPFGRTVATLIGILGGAVVGNSVESAPRARYEDVQRASTFAAPAGE
mgnify:CR=1 FL=1